VALTETVRTRLRLTGLVLMLLGVATLGWVGWQLFVTDALSQREHRATVEALREAWTSGQGSVTTDAGTVEAVVRIPRFGDEYAVPLVDGIDDDALAAGLGRVETGAEPGAGGNLAIVGHRITHGSPLRRMPELVEGDRIEIETVEGTFTYELVTGGDDLTVDFNEAWVFDQEPRNPDAGEVTAPAGVPALLTLATCAELFNTDDRLVAFGVLVEG
jgi:sortase A